LLYSRQAGDVLNLRGPGTVCRLRCEFWRDVMPGEGDFLRTAAGSCYRIEEWRPARAGSKSLGVFVCTRLEKDAVQFGEPGVFVWAFARRERGRTTGRP
jgi:hypothetical protein